MARSPFARRMLMTLAVALAVGVAVYAQKSGEDKKPSLSLKATPVTGFAPLRVRLTVDVKGGPNDFQDYYCPSVEWEWGDDLRSGNSGGLLALRGRQERDQAPLHRRARLPVTKAPIA